jgi:hypothetical protein
MIADCVKKLTLSKRGFDKKFAVMNTRPARRSAFLGHGGATVAAEAI